MKQENVEARERESDKAKKREGDKAIFSPQVLALLLAQPINDFTKLTFSPFPK